MSVKYTNPDTEDYATITVQDLANIQSQGRAVQQTQEYIGVRNEALAIRLAQRDLQSASATLATAEVTVNRGAWALNPGHVVTLQWPAEGITSMDMRVTDTTQAEPGTDSIKLTLVEDVFGQANANFNDVQDPGYEAPATAPELFDPEYAWEVPFWFIWNSLNKALTDYPTDVSYATVLANTNLNAALAEWLYAWTVQADGTSAWQQVGYGSITPVGVMKNALSADFQSVVDIQVVYRFNTMEDNAYAVIVDPDTGYEELVKVTNEDWENVQITITRGLFDTPPRPWPANSLIFFIGTGSLVRDTTVRYRGDTAQYRADRKSVV